MFVYSGDRTETGHILGSAARLGPITAPERKLNRASFAVLRLLTHLSMYIGADVNTEVNYFYAPSVSIQIDSMKF